MVREKAHTHEGDAHRRGPPPAPDGRVRRLTCRSSDPTARSRSSTCSRARDELVVYRHMWHDGAPHQGQCEGCTTTAGTWKDAVYLNARGVTVRHPDHEAGGTRSPPTSSSWATPSPGTRCATSPRRSVTRWVSSVLPARRRSRVPHHATTGRGNERGQRIHGPARRRRPTAAARRGRTTRRGWPGGVTPVLVLAHGRGRERHLGPDQPPRAAVDAGRRDPSRDPRPELLGQALHDLRGRLG